MFDYGVTLYLHFPCKATVNMTAAPVHSNYATLTTDDLAISNSRLLRDNRCLTRKYSVLSKHSKSFCKVKESRKCWTWWIRLAFEIWNLMLLWTGYYLWDHLVYSLYSGKRLCSLLLMSVLVYLMFCFVMLKKCCKVYGFCADSRTDYRAVAVLEHQEMVKKVSWWHRLVDFSRVMPSSETGAASRLAFQGGKWAVTPTNVWNAGIPCCLICSNKNSKYKLNFNLKTGYWSSCRYQI